MINFRRESFKAYITSNEELEKEDFYITKKEPYNFKINLSRRRKYEIKDLK